ncbi:MAG TPA: TetR/AcrR family transcriptional regulator [Kofleriaceae bacterium]|jgi:AcrR family transcriptional regulator
MARTRGRPRSATARTAILDATVQLVTRDGNRVTIDAIAAAAGVGKQTIYRWWKGRAEIMAEAIAEMLVQRVTTPDKGSLRADLAFFLAATFAVGPRSKAISALLRGLMVESQLDPSFHVQFRSRLIEPRRAVLRTIFQRAAMRGDLRRDFDIDLGIDIAFGVLWYRLLVRNAPLDRKAAAAIADAIARAAMQS